MTFPDQAPSVSDEELAALEGKVQKALASNTFDGLNVLGFGEVGVAVGIPTESPSAVAKRLPSNADRRKIEEWFGVLTAYEDSLKPFVNVAPTDKRIIEGGPEGRLVPYVIQPLYQKSQLAEKVLENEDPVVDHPMLVAIRDAALNSQAHGGQAVDSQFSNFAWDGENVTLFDCGTPFTFKADGSSDYKLGIYDAGFPKLLTPLMVKLAHKVNDELGTAKGNLGHAALSAVRLGQERWLDAIVETFNSGLADRGIDDSLDPADVMKQLDGLTRDMKAIKVIAKTNRAYVSKIKRQTYDFFITDSFTGELL